MNLSPKWYLLFFYHYLAEIVTASSLCTERDLQCLVTVIYVVIKEI